MGRVFTPKWAVRVEVAGPYLITPAVWRREYGRPNAKRLAEWVAKLELSSLPGGANEHLGPVNVRKAWIAENRAGGAVVAAFERAPEVANG